MEAAAPTGLFSPGLACSAGMRIRRVRELPIAGDICADLGQSVKARDCVARVQLPGGAANPKNCGKAFDPA